MVLFTKEVFLQLKKLINLHVNVLVNDYLDQGKQVRSETWQVFVYGICADGSAHNHNDTFQSYITCASKEDAYRLYKELAQQVVDSGEVTELNGKLIDDVLKEK